MVDLYRGSRPSQTRFKVAVLVLLAFVGPRPKGMECCHNDGDPENNSLDNLRWDTHSSNVYDAIRHGTHVSNAGHRNGRAKIFEDEALEVYDKAMDGVPLKTIGAEYGLHPEYVRLIKKGVYWSHVYSLVI